MDARRSTPEPLSATKATERHEVPMTLPRDQVVRVTPRDADRAVARSLIRLEDRDFQRVCHHYGLIAKSASTEIDDQIVGARSHAAGANLYWLVRDLRQDQRANPDSKAIANDIHDAVMCGEALRGMATEDAGDLIVMERKRFEQQHAALAGETQRQNFETKNFKERILTGMATGLVAMVTLWGNVNLDQPRGDSYADF